MLLSFPIEIRRAIYVHLINKPGIHIVRTEHGELGLSACIGPDIYAVHIRSERRATSDSSFDPIWGRRVASSWDRTGSARRLRYVYRTE